tara:strand:- start:66 stop:356 length:291 start_codon:yes stop_codon:yes gene_type:complete
MLFIPIFPKLLPVVYVDMSVLREVGQACATAKAAKKQRTVAKGLILGRLLLCTTYFLKIGLKINKSFPFFFLSFKLFNLYSFFFFFFFQIVSINVF